MNDLFSNIPSFLIAEHGFLDELSKGKMFESEEQTEKTNVEETSMEISGMKITDKIVGDLEMYEGDKQRVNEIADGTKADFSRGEKCMNGSN